MLRFAGKSKQQLKGEQQGEEIGFLEPANQFLISGFDNAIFCCRFSLFITLSIV